MGRIEANLRAIVERIRKETNATVLFATTTHVIDHRAAKVRANRDYELLAASVEEYNRIAETVMRELDVPVNDLHGGLSDASERDALMEIDGVHFGAEGKRRLGIAVAKFLAERLPGKSNGGDR